MRRKVNWVLVITLVILATWETKIRRFVVRGHPSPKKVGEIPSPQRKIGCGGARLSSQ
jgi:hypothetical protein